jgi:hypothetical protein
MDSGGGGLYYCNGTIQNNTITGNSAALDGGGLFKCDGTIRNNTITGNSAPYGGGLDDCKGVIRNCIIWGNSALSGPQLWNSSTPTYSCIQGWTEGGIGNIASDPLFVNAPAGDYHLRPDSPCIDSGLNEDWMCDPVDLDGNPRIWRGKTLLMVDMGAYEFGSWPFKVVGVAGATTGEAQLTWISRPGDNYVVWSCADLLAPEWLDEATVPSGGETTAWSDPEATSPRKFYRIELEP